MKTDELKDRMINTTIMKSILETESLMKNYNYQIFTRVLEEVEKEDHTEVRGMKIRFINNMTNLYSLIIQYKRLNDKNPEFEGIIQGMEMPDPSEFFGTDNTNEQETMIKLLKKNLRQLKANDKFLSVMIDEEE